MNAQPTVPPLLWPPIPPPRSLGSGFRHPGRVTVSTGRVEIGQGVLTADAADRRRGSSNVAPEGAFLLAEPATPDLTPQRGATPRAASRSNSGGRCVAPGLPPRWRAFVPRPPTPRRASAISRPDLSVARRRDQPSRPADRPRITGRSPAARRTFARDANRPGANQEGERLWRRRAGIRRASISRRKRCSANLSSPTNMVAGARPWVHGPASCRPAAGRGAAIANFRRGSTYGAPAKGGPIEILRHGNFLAILGADETVVEARRGRRPRPIHVAWGRRRCDQTRSRKEARVAVAASLRSTQTIGPAPSSGPDPRDDDV